MADPIDRADQEVERNLAEAMRQRRAPGPQPTGRCHYCDEVLDDVSRWCSVECRDQWSRLQRRL